jgi:hypothetical protein
MGYFLDIAGEICQGWNSFVVQSEGTIKLGSDDYFYYNDRYFSVTF